MREGKKAISRLFVGILLIAGCTGPPDPSTPTLAIRNTNVFDTHSGSFISGQTVLILGDRIVSVDPAEEVELSPATEVLDGEGKFLIPGLIDAHVHLTHVLYQAGITADEILPYFLANGVTTRPQHRRQCRGAELAPALGRRASRPNRRACFSEAG